MFKVGQVSLEQVHARYNHFKRSSSSEFFMSREEFGALFDVQPANLDHHFSFFDPGRKGKTCVQVKGEKKAPPCKPYPAPMSD